MDRRFCVCKPDIPKRKIMDRRYAERLKTKSIENPMEKT